MSNAEFYNDPYYDPFAHDNGGPPTAPAITYGDSTTAPPGVDTPASVPSPAPVSSGYPPHPTQPTHGPQLSASASAPQALHPQPQQYAFPPTHNPHYPQHAHHLPSPSPVSPTPGTPNNPIQMQLSYGPAVPNAISPASSFGPGIPPQQQPQPGHPSQYPPSYAPGHPMSPQNMAMVPHNPGAPHLQIHELDSGPQTPIIPNAEQQAMSQHHQKQQLNLANNHQRQVENQRLHDQEYMNHMQHLNHQQQQLQPQLQIAPPPMAYISPPQMTMPTSVSPAPTAPSVQSSIPPHPRHPQPGMQAQPPNISVVADAPEPAKPHAPAGHDKGYKQKAKRAGFLGAVMAVFCCCGATACQGCMESCTDCADCCAEAMQ